MSISEGGLRAEDVRQTFIGPDTALRRLIVFGLPRFSSAALAQFDPAPWTDASLRCASSSPRPTFLTAVFARRDSAFTPHDHPLPTPFWTWENDHWMVDMGHDVDEQGASLSSSPLQP